MTKLMAKAKIRLNLTDFKFPKYYYGAFEEIFKTFALEEANRDKDSPPSPEKLI